MLGSYIRKHTYLGTNKPKLKINDYCFRKIIITIKHPIKLSLPVGSMRRTVYTRRPNEFSFLYTSSRAIMYNSCFQQNKCLMFCLSSHLIQF